MKIFHGLIWTLFQVCWALECPRTVTAPLGGSVSVLCRYGEGKEELVKYWCKEAAHRLCSNNCTVSTTGSEAEKKWNTISIKDSHASRIFRVTMDNLTMGDTGTYLCGVESTRYDIVHPVDVIITPDAAASTDSLNRVLETVTEEPSFSPRHPKRIQQNNIHFLLLLIKIPIFSALIAAVVWVHVCYKESRSCRAKDPREARTHKAQGRKEEPNVTVPLIRNSLCYISRTISSLAPEKMEA